MQLSLRSLRRLAVGLPLGLLAACNEAPTAPVAPPAPASTVLELRSAAAGSDTPQVGSLLIQITGRVDSLIALQSGVRVWRLPDEADHFLLVGPVVINQPLARLAVPGQTALGYRVRVLEAASRSFVPLETAQLPLGQLTP